MATGAAALITLSLPGFAAGQVAPEAGDAAAAGILPPPPPKPANLDLRVRNASGGSVRVGGRITLVGQIRPFAPRQKVLVHLRRSGHPVKHARLRVRRYRDRNFGTFRMRSPELIEKGHYRFTVLKRATDRQERAAGRSRVVNIDYPDVDPGDCGSKVRIFNDLLDKQGYRAPNSSCYGNATWRAVLAFRKVNGRSRIGNASPDNFRTLAADDGEFKLHYPGAGHHAEVDISRQVMVLADDGKAKYTFHVSTGAAGTPSDRGSFRFYSKQPGYNNVGMYYSVYYNGGEATHGYRSVPTYPASHGCIRNPIPDARFIYGWINLGDRMYVYG